MTFTLSEDDRRDDGTGSGQRDKAGDPIKPPKDGDGKDSSPKQSSDN